MVRNTVQNTVLDLYISLKSALKIQEIQKSKFSRDDMPPNRPRILGLRPGNFNYVAPPMGNDNATPLDVNKIIYARYGAI